MTIPNGTRLGPYEIVAPIGAGGMGEVYRATDTRLRRSVALKILPESFVSDRVRLARFEHEARSTAALQHPNVVTIHDFGTDSLPYLVTELLIGESLADVLARGPLPLRRAMPWAAQILRGLSAAHAAGIVHRDLKPANIFITSEGTVKVLDFGLAKLVEDDEQSNSTTMVLSTPGTIVGTVGYMSPEQVRGLALDARSDIFSFAVVFYEMLTGKLPFGRATSAETLTAILRDDPPRLDTPPYPPVLADTLVRCLDKSPDARFHSAHDLALHIESIDTGSTGPRAVVRERSSSPPSVQQVTFHAGKVYHGRFAPDGSIVYGAAWGDRPLEVYVVHRGLPDARPLGIAGSIHSVSRNGELAVSLGRRAEVGFLALGTLARVPLAGGVPRPIAKDVLEADWSPDGRTLAIARRVESGFQIEYPIGKAIYHSASWFSHLRVSPAGDRIAFIEHPYPFVGDNFGYVVTVDLDGNAKRLTEDLSIAWGLAWHPAKEEIWYSAAPVNSPQGKTVMVHAVDLSGTSREIFASLGAVFLHDVASDGTLLVSHEDKRRVIIGHIDGQDRDLSWFDWSFPVRLSRDGTMLLFEEQATASGGRLTMYLRDTAGGPAFRLDEGRARDLSADGSRVLALANDSPKLYVVPTGAGTTEEIRVEGLDHIGSARYLPGEREILLVGSRGDESARFWRVPSGGGKAELIAEEAVPSWLFVAVSPDGEWIASTGSDRTTRLFAVHGESRVLEMKGGEPGDIPVHWPAEDHLYVAQRDQYRAHIFDVNIRTGERTLLRTLAPHDPAGVEQLFPVHFADDVNTYVFGYRLMLSSLFIVSGVD